MKNVICSLTRSILFIVFHSQQDGYRGPFEYIKPVSDNNMNGWDGETYPCGCFRNYDGSSYFPDDKDMQLSVW